VSGFPNNGKMSSWRRYRLFGVTFWVGWERSGESGTRWGIMSHARYKARYIAEWGPWPAHWE
jgi:hypothetical protein